MNIKPNTANRCLLFNITPSLLKFLCKQSALTAMLLISISTSMTVQEKLKYYAKSVITFFNLIKDSARTIKLNIIAHTAIMPSFNGNTVKRSPSINAVMITANIAFRP